MCQIDGRADRITTANTAPAQLDGHYTTAVSVNLSDDTFRIGMKPIEQLSYVVLLCAGSGTGPGLLVWSARR